MCVGQEVGGDKALQLALSSTPVAPLLAVKSWIGARAGKVQEHQSPIQKKKREGVRSNSNLLKLFMQHKKYLIQMFFFFCYELHHLSHIWTLHLNPGEIQINCAAASSFPKHGLAWKQSIPALSYSPLVVSMSELPIKLRTVHRLSFMRMFKVS